MITIPLLIQGIEDELQNVLMAEHERTTQRLDLKTKKKGYTGYDDDEFTDGQAGMKRHVLSKYDEDINGPQEQVWCSRLSEESCLTTNKTGL